MADLRHPLVVASAAPLACGGLAKFVDGLRVLVASGDGVGHLSHTAVPLDALALRYRVRFAVVLPRDPGDLFR